MSTLIQNLKISSVEEAEEILKSAGTEDLFEKAHQDGDMHPNGKWVWCASANGGKGDWRVAKKGSSSTSGGSGSAGNTGPSNASSSYFSKLNNFLIEKYSKKKESVSLSDIEEFYEDFLRDRGQEPTRKAYANEAKKTYDAIVANWNKKPANPLGFKVGDTAIWDEKANKVTKHTKVLIVDLNEKTDTAKIKAPKNRGTFTVSISVLKLPKEEKHEM